MNDDLIALVLDDETRACRLIENLINEFCPEIQKVFTTTSPVEARKYIEEENPEILFLDVNMPHENGFEFLESLEDFNGQIIFTTAHSEHAIQAIKSNALDYLLKPIKIDELKNAVKKAVSSVNIDQSNNIQAVISALNQEVGSYKTSVAIPDKNGMVFLKVKDILFLEGVGNYTKIYTAQKEYMSSKTSKSFESILDPKIFARVHKSFIVNIEEVVRFHQKDGGELQMSSGHFVPVSRRKRHVLNDFSV